MYKMIKLSQVSHHYCLWWYCMWTTVTSTYSLFSLLLSLFVVYLINKLLWFKNKLLGGGGAKSIFTYKRWLWHYFKNPLLAKLLRDKSNSLSYKPRNTFTCKLHDCTSHGAWLCHSNNSCWTLIGNHCFKQKFLTCRSNCYFETSKIKSFKVLKTRNCFIK